MSANSHLKKVTPSFHFFSPECQVTDQSHCTAVSSLSNARCLAVVEGDYSGLVSVRNDEAANYSFDYKGFGQKWSAN